MGDNRFFVDLTGTQPDVHPQNTSGADPIYLDLTQEQIALVGRDQASHYGPEVNERGEEDHVQVQQLAPVDDHCSSF